MVAATHGFVKPLKIALIKNYLPGITFYVIQKYPGSLIDTEKTHITEMSYSPFI